MKPKILKFWLSRISTKRPKGLKMCLLAQQKPYMVPKVFIFETWVTVGKLGTQSKTHALSMLSSSFSESSCSNFEVKKMHVWSKPYFDQPENKAMWKWFAELATIYNAVAVKSFCLVQILDPKPYVPWSKHRRWGPLVIPLSWTGFK